MTKAIMRCTKIKTLGSAAASLGHTYRTLNTPNANPELKRNNVHLVGGSVDTVMGNLRSKLPEKRRKDAVLAIEYVMTARHEWWQTISEEQHQEFFSQSMDWLNDKYGKDNLIEATIHYDELTPHLTALVVPLKDEKLNAFHYIGSRQKLRDDQTSYAKCVEHLGLERGIEGSKAQHKTVKQFYKELEIKEQNIPQIHPEELKSQKMTGETLVQKVFGAVETDIGIALRLNQKIHNAVAPTYSNALNDRLRADRLETVEKVASESQKQLKRIFNAFKGLSLNEIVSIGDKYTQAIEKQRQEKERLQQEALEQQQREQALLQEHHSFFTEEPTEEEIQKTPVPVQQKKVRKIRR